jgi:hypothetical protein
MGHEITVVGLASSCFTSVVSIYFPYVLVQQTPYVTDGYPQFALKQ